MTAPAVRFGINFTQQVPVERIRPWWQAADRVGIAMLGLPDSPLLLRELYVTTAAAALATTRIRLLTCVSNPVTRHPSVTAAALLTLAELAPGRIAFGIGTGDSALWSIGEKPARIVELRAYIRALKALLRGEHAAWRGHRFKPQWSNAVFPVDIPLLIACAGSKMLAMAAEEADGFLINMGYAPAQTAWIQETIETAARAAGRDPAPLEVWWNAPVAFAESRAAAMAGSLGWGLNWLTEGTMEGKGIPEQLKEPIRRFNADNHDLYAVYRMPDRGRVLVERAKTLGIYDWAIEQSPQLFGTPDDVAARLRTLAARGLTRWMCFQPMHGAYGPHTDAARLGYIEKLAAVAARVAGPA